MQDLGTLGGEVSFGAAINDAGQVVGYSDTVDYPFHHAFLYGSRGMIDLGTLGGAYSEAFAINQAGQVTGKSWTSENRDHAFLYDGGQMKDLGTLGGATSEGYDINDAGQVVGNSSVPNNGPFHGFLFSNGAMRDLIDLVHEPGLTYFSFFPWSAKINNRGQIIASALTTSGPHAFLLTPISVLLEELLSDVAGVGPDSKLSKLVTLAQTYYGADDLQPLCSQLTYFNDQVQNLVPKKGGQELRGPKITQGHADGLVDQSNAIMVAVGCP
jgi:probable HAF family extracellular repeat protein